MMNMLVNIQYFNQNGEVAWQQDVGIKIHGNWTRGFDQKSFGFYAKSQTFRRQQACPEKPLHVEAEDFESEINKNFQPTRSGQMLLTFNACWKISGVIIIKPLHLQFVVT